MPPNTEQIADELLILRRNFESFEKLSVQTDAARKELENILLKETLAASNERYVTLQKQFVEQLGLLGQQVEVMSTTDTKLNDLVWKVKDALMTAINKEKDEHENSISTLASKIAKTLEPIQTFHKDLKEKRHKHIFLGSAIGAGGLLLLIKLGVLLHWAVFLWFLGLPAAG